MKDFIWSDTLSVQVDEIDDDHRKLVELCRIIKIAVEEGAATDYIKALMDELISYTEYHFKHEERLMLKYDYDGAAEHKIEHQELIDSVHLFRKELFEEGKPVTSEDISGLEDWLTGHIYCSDMNLGSYLCELM